MLPTCGCRNQRVGVRTLIRTGIRGKYGHVDIREAILQMIKAPRPLILAYDLCKIKEQSPSNVQNITKIKLAPTWPIRNIS